MGKVGLPMPVAELAARDWDAIVVGGGHNGLTAAAYLARAGQSVLVLERREQLGGACTLEQPFADQRYLVSPCAYVVGLLDELVVSELELARPRLPGPSRRPEPLVPVRGRHLLRRVPRRRADRGAHARRTASPTPTSAACSPTRTSSTASGWRCGTGAAATAWVGSSPSRERIEELLGGDEEMISVVFEESITATLDRYVQDERLRDALFGQGIIGAFAAPGDPGTASVKLMHHQGDLLGQGSIWGYVEGGMGRVSFAIAEAAQEAGAVIAAGVAGRRDPARGGSGAGERRAAAGARRWSATPTRSGPWRCSTAPSRRMPFASGSRAGRCARRWSS